MQPSTDGTPSRPRRSRGGAPPSIDEHALRSRYGQPAVDLVSSLDRLARAGGFTRNDAARHWADRDPQGAREHGILKVSDTGVGSIERRRLSETMKMDKGPIPTGLVEAFLELWARQRPTAEVRTVTDRLVGLCDEVAQAEPAATGAPTRRRTPRATSDATASLADKKELLRTRQELSEAQEKETRFRDLSRVLYVALAGLQTTHRQVVEDRDEALTKAEAAGSHSHDTAEQLRQAFDRALSAERMVQQLQADNRTLTARLEQLHNPHAHERESAVVRRGQPPDNPLDRTFGPAETDRPPSAKHDVLTPPWAEQDSPGTATRPYLRRLLSGWRKAVHALTAGPGSTQESPTGARRRELITRITRPSARCHKIAVVGVESGVGASVITGCLGSALARLRYQAAAERPDRVIVVDANPDGGDTPVARISREPTATVYHLLRDASRITGYDDLRAYTVQTPSRLEILVSDIGPVVSEAFGVHDYPAALALLERSYDIVLTDCGTGLTNPAIKGILDVADSLVLVSSDSVNGTQALAATLDSLQSHGHHSLVARSVTVIKTGEPGSREKDPGNLPAHLAQRCRTVVRIPFDARLEDDPCIEPANTGEETRLALLELAAAVADDFSDLDPRGLPMEPATQPIKIVPAAVPHMVPTGVFTYPRTEPITIVPTEPPTQPIRIVVGPASYPGTPIPWIEKIRIVEVLFAANKLTPDTRTAARNLAFRSAGFPHPDIEREFRALVNRAVGEPRRTVSRLIFHHPQFPTSSQAATALDAAWNQGALTEREYLTKRYWIWEFGRHTPPRVPRADAIYVLDARLAEGALSPDEYCEIVAAVKQRTDQYPADYPDEPIRSWP